MRSTSFPRACQRVNARVNILLRPMKGNREDSSRNSESHQRLDWTVLGSFTWGDILLLLQAFIILLIKIYYLNHYQFADCIDSQSSCPRWAFHGECEKNKAWMLANCRKSCNQCGGKVSDLVFYGLKS